MTGQQIASSEARGQEAMSDPSIVSSEVRCRGAMTGQRGEMPLVLLEVIGGALTKESIYMRCAGVVAVRLREKNKKPISFCEMDLSLLKTSSRRARAFGLSFGSDKHSTSFANDTSDWLVG